jgi:hypothetical protein
VLALSLAALSIASNLRVFPRMGIAISSAFFPHGFHLFAALVTQFAEAGYKKAMQVFTPGVVFGFAHAGYLNQGVLVWLGIAVPTAFLGMMWGIASCWAAAA